MDNKQCKKCGESKPLSEYYPRRNGTGYTSYCKPCASEQAKQRYIDKKEHINIVQKNWYNKQRQASHNNWEQYFKNRVGAGRGKYKLTPEDCLDILKKQKGLCALSGVPLTCLVGNYNEHPPTNASLDRILTGKDGGEYTKDNIRLVCLTVNTMRLHQSDEDLLWWCKQILEKSHAIHEES